MRFTTEGEINDICFEARVYPATLYLEFVYFCEINKEKSVADPGFPRRRGAPIPEDGGKNLLFCRKLHENERIWTKNGNARP